MTVEPQGSTCLCLSSIWIQCAHHWTQLLFYVSSGICLGPCVCKASALLTETPPQLLNSFKKKSEHFAFLLGMVVDISNLRRRMLGDCETEGPLEADLHLECRRKNCFPADGACTRASTPPPPLDLKVGRSLSLMEYF